MAKKVLIAYTTVNGATGEIAEFIKGILETKGIQAEVFKMKDVKSLSGYSAAVIGAPLYMFHLKGDLLRFVNRFKQEFQQGLRAVVFSGGPFGEATPEIWADVEKSLQKELAKAAWFKPVSVKVVGGRFDPEHLNFPYNLLPAMKMQPASDLRDWDDIRKWTEEIAEIIGQ